MWLNVCSMENKISIAIVKWIESSCASTDHVKVDWASICNKCLNGNAFILSLKFYQLFLVFVSGQPTFVKRSMHAMKNLLYFQLYWKEFHKTVICMKNLIFISNSHELLFPDFFFLVFTEPVSRPGKTLLFKKEMFKIQMK